MKNFYLIGHNELRLFIRTRIAFIWVFVAPLMFVYFMGFAMRGPGDPSNPKPGVLVENNDTNFLGRMFMEELGEQGLWLVNPTNKNEAERGIRIPSDFTEKVLSEKSAELQLFKTDKGNQSASMLLDVKFFRALISMNACIVQSALKNSGNPAINEESLRKYQKAPKPVLLNARFAGRKPIPTGFNFSLPGNLVMYLMMNLLIFGGATVAWGRRSGVLRRILTNPVKRLELVFGKIYGLMLMGIVQIVFFLVIGKFLLKVNLGANIVAVFTTLLLLAWVSASMGVLIGSLIKSEDKVVGLCVITSIMAGALGGCWWPLELGPEHLRTIAHCIPTGWAMDALHQVISFGGDLSDAAKPMLALIGFGLGFNVLAIKFFRV